MRTHICLAALLEGKDSKMAHVRIAFHTQSVLGPRVPSGDTSLAALQCVAGLKACVCVVSESERERPQRRATLTRIPLMGVIGIL